MISSSWVIVEGAAAGFSVVFEQAKKELQPLVGKLVPKLFRFVLVFVDLVLGFFTWLIGIERWFPSVGIATTQMGRCRHR